MAELKIVSMVKLYHILLVRIESILFLGVKEAGYSLYRIRVNDLLYQLNIFLLLLFFEARLCRCDQSVLWCDLSYVWLQ